LITADDLSRNGFESLFGPPSGAHALLDSRDTAAAVSDAFLALLGLARGGVIGQPVAEILSEFEARAGCCGLARFVQSGLRDLRGSRALQVGPLFELGSGAESTSAPRRQLRAVLTPLVGSGESVEHVILSFEDPSGAASAVRDLVHERDALAQQLEHLQRDWHVRVRERTAELEHANDRLLREIAEHMRTEKELARTQDQLHHAQRLEAVGRLAGGIAHDFNNMLSVVLGYSISLIDALPEDSRIREDLEEIRHAGERAAELTRQLLAFGRRQVLDPKVLDLNSVVSEVDRMMRRVLGEDIEFVTLLTEPLWKVKVDRGQIEQVLTNLMVNARDAMPQGGTLTVETAQAVFDEDYAREHPGSAIGPHVVLAVSDTGIGMDKATQARVFEPFFTTKEKGKGSGLGLAMVFGIVKQSGGHIWLYSEPGRGSTFKLCFPRTESALSVPEVSAVAPPITLPLGNETILLVEDDPQLRTLARTILDRQGYRVLDAGVPSDALKVCEGFAGEISLLVTDVVMPQMSGRELALRIAAARPSIRVLYMSGYTDNAIVHQGILDPGVEFLQKPITPDTLARRVRQVLDG
jgi:two-component system, cell cycle sensor histidine kinase and response regulator CckA